MKRLERLIDKLSSVES